MPYRSLNEGPAAEQLDTAECWRLLGTRSHGRICFCVEDHVEVVLTSYVALVDTIYFRATAFGPVARLAESRDVTLQVDDMDGDRPASWSVTVTGPSHRVVEAPTLAALWTPVRPAPWDTAAEPIWMALSDDVVLGRRKLRADGVSPGSTPTTRI